MKHILGLILFAILLSICVSACSTHQKPSMIKSERRFAKYMEPQNKPKSGVIDLSEGPKIKYDATFGPSSPEFDFKIKNPYSY